MSYINTKHSRQLVEATQCYKIIKPMYKLILMLYTIVATCTKYDLLLVKYESVFMGHKQIYVNIAMYNSISAMFIERG